MKSYDAKFPAEFEALVDTKKVASSNAIDVESFEKLTEYSAKLAYRNKNQLLFYRGQDEDYRKRGNSSTFYPKIYRGEYLKHDELKARFNKLKVASNELVKICCDDNIDGNKELKRKIYIQWSILQHYEVCSTPLLDLTQSLRVACTFAQYNNDSDYGYIYVFGLPYLTNRISINSEEDIVNIRLLSISPPDALRPYFQEGYQVGTTDIREDYEKKQNWILIID